MMYAHGGDAMSYVNTHLGGIGQFISTSARFEKMHIKYGTMTLEQRQKNIAQLIPRHCMMSESFREFMV